MSCFTFIDFHCPLYFTNFTIVNARLILPSNIAFNKRHCGIHTNFDPAANTEVIRIQEARPADIHRTLLHMDQHQSMRSAGSTAWASSILVSVIRVYYVSLGFVLVRIVLPFIMQHMLTTMLCGM